MVSGLINMSSFLCASAFAVEVQGFLVPSRAAFPLLVVLLWSPLAAADLASEERELGGARTLRRRTAKTERFAFNLLIDPSVHED